MLGCENKITLFENQINYSKQHLAQGDNLNRELD